MARTPIECGGGIGSVASLSGPTSSISPRCALSHTMHSARPDFSSAVSTSCDLMHQKCPNVHHLVSEVSGTLAPESTEVDLWRATFPGGSITGAPKIRACEIISEMEKEQRGIYCGAIGFLDPRGGGCANIPIRTGVVHQRRLNFHVGGGIVADSTPEREGVETEEKAAGWLKTLGLPPSLG